MSTPYEHWDLRNVPLNPHIKPLSRADWYSMKNEYYNEEGQQKIFELMETAKREGLIGHPVGIPEQSFSPNIADSVFAPNNVEKFEISTDPRYRANHAVTTIKQPFNKGYYFVDPHGKPTYHPLSASKSIDPYLQSLPGVVKQFDNPGSLQGNLGTCDIWAELQYSNPEKQNDKFVGMINEAMNKTGLTDFKNTYGYTNRETNDLLPVAFLEQLVREGRPEASSELRHDIHRRSLVASGKYKKKGISRFL